VSAKVSTMEKKALKVLLICVCVIILLMTCIGLMARMFLSSEEIGKESPTPSSYPVLASSTEYWENETTTQGSLETNQTISDEISKEEEVNVILMGKSCQVGDICIGNTKVRNNFRFIFK
jgi:flagellar basal body-associated protein FliL